MRPKAPAADVAGWYERYRSSVRGAAARVVRDPDDADDALQETFLAAWRARRRFEVGREPLPWLLAIARRKALTIASRRPAVPDPGTLAVAPSAADEALRRESDAWVATLLRDEPALALRVIDGLTLGAVGERLGLPLRTAASRVRRGSQRVRSRIQATTPSFSESEAS